MGSNINSVIVDGIVKTINFMDNYIHIVLFSKNSSLNCRYSGIKFREMFETKVDKSDRIRVTGYLVSDIENGMYIEIDNLIIKEIIN